MTTSANSPTAAGKRDTGKVDLAAMVDYLDTFASTTPLPVDYAQHAVEVAFPDAAPAAYAPGSTVGFDVKSWTMTNPTDVKDTEVVVSLGDEVLGAFPLDNTIGTELYDNYGTASVSVQLPADVPAGPAQLLLTGAATGTSIMVPIEVFEKADSYTLAWPSKVVAKKGTAVEYTVRVAAEGDAVPTGVVTIHDRCEGDRDGDPDRGRQRAGQDQAAEAQPGAAPAVGRVRGQRPREGVAGCRGCRWSYGDARLTEDGERMPRGRGPAASVVPACGPSPSAKRFPGWMSEAPPTLDGCPSSPSPAPENSVFAVPASTI